jgi:hypothetical protein
MPQENLESNTLSRVVISFSDEGFSVALEMASRRYPMDDCQCDNVPDGPIAARTETNCPVCRGRVRFLSGQDFERVLKTIFRLQTDSGTSEKTVPSEP